MHLMKTQVRLNSKKQQQQNDQYSSEWVGNFNYTPLK
jgi:hypothetical protein